MRRRVVPEPGAPRGARRWWWVLPLLLAVLVAGGLWLAHRTDLWTVRAVEVEVEAPEGAAGWREQLASPKKVREQAGIGLGDRVVELDPGAAKRRLEELPGVRSAEVGRGWSRTVEVRVVLSEPVAQVEHDGAWRVLDVSGRRIIDLDERAAGTPVIEPAPGLPEREYRSALRRALPALRALSGETREQVREFRVSESGLITLLPDSHVVIWGDGVDADAVREQEKSVRAVLEEQPPGPGATLDASQPGQVVVRP